MKTVKLIVKIFIVAVPLIVFFVVWPTGAQEKDPTLQRLYEIQERFEQTERETQELSDRLAQDLEPEPAQPVRPPLESTGEWGTIRLYDPDTGESKRLYYDKWGFKDPY